MGRIIVKIDGDAVSVYNTDPGVEVILLGGDDNDRIIPAGVVPPDVWDEAKDLWDSIHDPDYDPNRDTALEARGRRSK